MATDFTWAWLPLSLFGLYEFNCVKWILDKWLINCTSGFGMSSYKSWEDVGPLIPVSIASYITRMLSWQGIS